MGCLGKLLGLLKGILPRRAIQHKHHLMRSIGDHLGHHVANLGQLVHQTHLVVQTAGRVDQHHIGSVGHGRLQRIEGYRGGVTTHLLADHRRPGPLGPDGQLIDGCGAERVGGSDIDLAAGPCELGGQLTDRRRLSGSIYTHHHQHVGHSGFHLDSEVLLRAGGLLHQKGDLLA